MHILYILDIHSKGSSSDQDPSFNVFIPVPVSKAWKMAGLQPIITILHQKYISIFDTPRWTWPETYRVAWS
jgi:hypothetical protein